MAKNMMVPTSNTSNVIATILTLFEANTKKVLDMWPLAAVTFAHCMWIE